MAERRPQNFGEVLLGSLGKGLGHIAEDLPRYEQQKRLAQLTEYQIQDMIQRGKRGDEAQRRAARELELLEGDYRRKGRESAVDIGLGEAQIGREKALTAKTEKETSILGLPTAEKLPTTLEGARTWYGMKGLPEPQWLTDAIIQDYAGKPTAKSTKLPPNYQKLLMEDIEKSQQQDIKNLQSYSESAPIITKLGGTPPPFQGGQTNILDVYNKKYRGQAEGLGLSSDSILAPLIGQQQPQGGMIGPQIPTISGQEGWREWGYQSAKEAQQALDARYSNGEIDKATYDKYARMIRGY